MDILIRPGIPIPADAIDVHGITDDMVADAPSFGDIYSELAELLANKTIVSYGADFDRRVLGDAAEWNDLPEVVPFVSAWLQKLPPG